MTTKSNPDAGVLLRIAPALVFIMLILTGCGSSPPVAVEKSMILHGKMYQVARYSTYAAIVEGQLPNGEVVGLTNVKRAQFNDYLKQGSPIQVTTKFVMDDTNIVYESKTVKGYSELSSMASALNRAAKKFSRFMDDPGESQLKLD